jgi:hypothetical protein
VTAEAQPIVDALSDRFAKDGYRVRALLRTIALSDAFSDVVDGDAMKTADAGSKASTAK